MRIGIVLCAALALCALAAAPATAGSKMAACDAVTAPGGTITTTVELTNTSDRPVRFKVSARAQGDRDNVAGPHGKVRGRKAKQTITVGAGEKVRQEIDCDVPSGALGPMVVSVTVTGPDGRENYEAGSWAFPNGEMPDPSDPPQDWSEPELLELTGTVTLSEDYYPWTYYGKSDGSDGSDGQPMPGDGWMPPPFESALKFVSDDDDDEWQLIGPEAWVLAALMWKADITETTATVSGYPIEEIPIYYGEENGLSRKNGKNRGGSSSDTAASVLFLLGWQADDIEDPRPKLVEFRWILDGDRSRIEGYAEYVVQDEDEWETMLAVAGITLPDPSDFEEWTDPANGFTRGSPGADGDLPPDYWYPWQVDFDNETVLGLFIGERSTTGFWVCVDRIVREDDSLHVQYYVMEPDPYMVVLDVVTCPFTIVALPKTDEDYADEDIIFEEVDAPTWYYDVPMSGARDWSR
jgi:hypothetical protein